MRQLTFFVLLATLGGAAGAEGRLVPRLPAPGERIRLLIDTDAACEIDDLYALALAVTSPDRFDIEGLVYGFESVTLDDGSAAHSLAVELVDGEELAERLTRGPIPIDEALEIARPLVEVSPPPIMSSTSCMGVGAGSLVGQWMNDSGFWIFRTMTGLTGVETLKAKSVRMAVLGFSAMAITLLASRLLPLV